MPEIYSEVVRSTILLLLPNDNLLASFGGAVTFKGRVQFRDCSFIWGLAAALVVPHRWQSTSCFATIILVMPSIPLPILMQRLQTIRRLRLRQYIFWLQESGGVAPVRGHEQMMVLSLVVPHS